METNDDTRDADAAPPTIRESLRRLPLGPGVYLLKDAQGAIIYVGKARNVRSRVRSYFQASVVSAKVAALAERTAAIDTIVTGSEVEALLLEMNLIKEHRPRYNVMLRDDKKFPFLKVTVNELFPQIVHTRHVKDDGARYFGPYTDAKAMRKAESTLRTIFPIRSCRYTFPTKRQVRVCLDYHLKKCPGPCEGLISPEGYREMIDGAITFLQGRGEEVLGRLRAEMKGAAASQNYEMAAFYRDQVRAMEKVGARQSVNREGGEDRDLFALARRGTDAVVVLMKVRGGRVIGRDPFELRVAPEDEDAEIIESVVERVYANAPFLPAEVVTQVPIDEEGTIAALLRERRGARVAVRCPARGERLALLGLARKNAEQLLTDRVLRRSGRNTELSTALLALQEALGLTRYPMRIDCLDISHVQGSDPVGASVSFVGGKPSKALYRRYKIRGGFGNDDFASMREVVERKARRAREGGEELPDLLVIDGGRGQLSSAIDALEASGAADLPVIALAKEEEEIYLPSRRSSLRLPPSPPLKLLQRLRDETHRFAVTYHRTRRTKRVIQTQLTGIPGVGPAIARRVLEAFGSVEGARAAGAEKLAAVPGVGRRLAELIADALARSADAGAAGTATVRSDRAPNDAASPREPDDPT
jgi:excinuclease ABC subunit C